MYFSLVIAPRSQKHNLIPYNKLLVSRNAYVTARSSIGTQWRQPFVTSNRFDGYPMQSHAFLCGSEHLIPGGMLILIDIIIVVFVIFFCFLRTFFLSIVKTFRVRCFLFFFIFVPIIIFNKSSFGIVYFQARWTLLVANGFSSSDIACTVDCAWNCSFLGSMDTGVGLGLSDRNFLGTFTESKAVLT